jgi:hypothetical protein
VQQRGARERGDNAHIELLRFGSIGDGHDCNSSGVIGSRTDTSSRELSRSTLQGVCQSVLIATNACRARVCGRHR